MKKIFRFLLALTLLTTVPMPLLAQEEALEEVEEVEEISNVAELAPKSNKLMDDFNSLKLELQGQSEFLENSKELLSIRKEEFAALQESITELTNSKFVNYDNLTELANKLRSLVQNADNEVSKYTEKITKLTQQKQEWNDKNEDWKNWQKEFRKDYNVVKNVFDEAYKHIGEAISSFQNVDKTLLFWQSEWVSFQSEAKLVLGTLDSRLESFRKDTFTKTNHPFWSPLFWDDFNLEMMNEGLKSLNSISPFNIKEGPTSKQQMLFGLMFLIFVFVVLSLRNLEKRKIERGRLKKFFSHPIATGLFISIVLVGPYLGSNLPVFLKVLILTLCSISGVILVTEFIDVKSRRVFLIFLVIAYLISRLLAVINIPEPIIRLYIFSLALVILIFSINHIRHIKQSGGSVVDILVTTFLAVLLVTTIVAEVGGYAQLALGIFDSSVRCIFSCVLGWLAVILIREIFFVLFSYSYLSKFSIVSKFATPVLRKINFWSAVFIFFLTFASILQTWNLVDSVKSGLDLIFDSGSDIFGHRINVGDIVFSIFIFQLITFISWVIRQILNDEFYPKRNVQLGVRLSINRIIQYFFWCVAILLALTALGFNLQNLAVAFGVLGVGIGFGLQNIVNNFASGIILLFERPLKIGDVVEVSGQRGTVKNLGLRATIVETYDKSELIVPNSDIAASMVTNLTLSDRQVRSTFNIGVSYDSDVNLVSELLKQIAAEHESVLKDPAPKVIFNAFGDSALEFQLFVWSSIDDILTIRSDINTKIYNEFKKNGIEIPFPQRDVSIKGLKELLEKK